MFHNRRRRHLMLEMRSPVKYEKPYRATRSRSEFPNSKRKRNNFSGGCCSHLHLKNGLTSFLTSYLHVILSDRIEIEKLLDSGYSQTMIAAQVGCHRSTISRVLGAGPGRLNGSMRTFNHICATSSTPGCPAGESISPGKPNTTRRNGKYFPISRIG